MEKKSELKLLDMEHNLAGDNAEAYAKKYDRTLLLLKKHAQAAVDGGMEQKEYAKALRLACGKGVPSASRRWVTSNKKSPII